MSDFKTVKIELTNYILARTPFIVLETKERERGEAVIREVASSNKIDISYYTDSKQVYLIANEGNYQSANFDPIQYAIDNFKKKKGMIFAIGDAKHLENDNSYSRALLNAIYIAKERGCTLIVLSSDFVWTRLVSLGLVVKLDYPHFLERKELIEGFINTYKKIHKIDWDSDSINQAASLMKGFSEAQISNILSAELVTNKGLFKKNLFNLTEQKNRIFGSIPNVTLIDVPSDIHVSGLENLKEWLIKKKKIFFANTSILNKYHLEAPKGILLAGVPGCGKSFSAKMISVFFDIPLFKFDLANIYDKYVGESERKMKEALEFIDNVAPCILWIDEIEKALATSNDGNDTGKRVLAQFLFWLQESKSHVFLVATANDISLLPPELFRKGRFSEIFFIDLPNKIERIEALRQYINDCIDANIDEKDLLMLADITEGYSYSDIETAIKEAAEMHILDPSYKISIDDIRSDILSIVPISKSNPEVVEKCRAWGYEKACFASKREGD